MTHSDPGVDIVDPVELTVPADPAYVSVLRIVTASLAARRDFTRDELVAVHLPLVRYLARRFGGRGESHDDLVQIGTIGLIQAVDRFETERGLDSPPSQRQTSPGRSSDISGTAAGWSGYMSNCGMHCGRCWPISVSANGGMLRFVDNKTQSEIAEVLGISQVQCPGCWQRLSRSYATSCPTFT